MYWIRAKGREERSVLSIEEDMYDVAYATGTKVAD
jgi:hypothetical protein